jgi:hypothetical protein
VPLSESVASIDAMSAALADLDCFDYEEACRKREEAATLAARPDDYCPGCPECEHHARAITGCIETHLLTSSLSTQMTRRGSLTLLIFGA